MLLDYPYVYRVDEAKLFCNRVDEFGNRCTGLIDYDAGFNHLFCTKCGKRYLALDLEDKNPVNDIVIRRGGKYPMKVTIVNSDGTRTEPIRSSSVMVKPAKKSNEKFSGLKVRISGSEETIKEDKPEVKEEVYQEQPIEETTEMTQEAPEEIKEEIQTESSSDEPSSKSEVTTITEIDESETPIKDESVSESIPEVPEEETKKQEPVYEEETEEISSEDEKKTPAKKPSTKKTSTSSKVKVSGKAKVATKGSKSTVKSNFIETEE